MLEENMSNDSNTSEHLRTAVDTLLNKKPSYKNDIIERDIDNEISYRDIEDIEDFLTKGNHMEEVNSCNSQGYYVIHFAYHRALDKSNPEVEVLKLLLSDRVNADPNPVHPELKIPILFDVIYRFVYDTDNPHKKEIFECILKSKHVKLTYNQNEKLISALHVAASINYTFGVDLLVKYIKKWNISDADCGVYKLDEAGQTPICYAVKNTNYEMANQLIGISTLKIDNKAMNLLADQSMDGKTTSKNLLFESLLKQQDEQDNLPDFFFLFSPDPPADFNNTGTEYSEGFTSEERILMQRLSNATDLGSLNTQKDIKCLLGKSDMKRREIVQDSPNLFYGLVDKVLKNVILTENEEIFKAMTEEGQWLWAKMQLFLEKYINFLYESESSSSEFDCNCISKTGFSDLKPTEGRLTKCFNAFVKKSFLPFGKKCSKFLMSRYNLHIPDFLADNLKDQMTPPILTDNTNRQQLRSFPTSDQEEESMLLGSDTLPKKSLLLWSIFCGRWKLTECLLYRTGFHSIPLLLVVINVLKKMARLKCHKPQHEEDLRKLRNLCEDRLVTLADVCLDLEDRRKNVSISHFLGRHLAEYDNMSCVDLASRCSNKKIFEHRAFEYALKMRLYGVFWDRSWKEKEFLVNLALGLFYFPLLLYAKYLRRANSNSTRTSVEPTDSQTDRGDSDNQEFSCLLTIETASCSDGNRNIGDDTKVLSNVLENGAALDQISVGDFYRTPFVKIFHCGVSYIIFFIMTAYIISNDEYDYCKNAKCVVFLYMYVMGFLAEALADIYKHWKDGTVKSKCIRNLCNWLDWLILISFLTRTILSLFHVSNKSLELNGTLVNLTSSSLPFNSTEVHANYKLIFIVSGHLGHLLFGMRLLYVWFLTNKHIGPKLYLSFLLLKNETVLMLLMSFCGLIGSVLFATHSGWRLFKSICGVAYFTIFGEYNIDCDIHVHEFNLKGFFFVFALPLLVIFMQLLVTNLIIAQFATTEEYVKKSECLRHRRRYLLVVEIERHSNLPSPLNILEILYEVIRHVGAYLHSKLARSQSETETFLQKLCRHCNSIFIVPPNENVKKALEDKSKDMNLRHQFFLALALRKERLDRRNETLQNSSETN